MEADDFFIVDATHTYCMCDGRFAGSRQHGPEGEKWGWAWLANPEYQKLDRSPVLDGPFDPDRPLISLRDLDHDVQFFVFRYRR